MDYEKYAFKWHTYTDHLRGMMKDMMLSEDFADVTLVSDDRKTIKAHRNILSACSPVLQGILQLETLNNHPVIYLRGIQFSEIESIIQFMYLGEAKFYVERMDEFLSVIKNLEIKELIKGVESNESETENTSDEATAEKSPENFNEKEDVDIVESNNDTSQQLQINKQISNKSKFQCTQCGKSYSEGTGLRRHIQSVHVGVKYACNQCDYQGTQQSNLYQHIRSKHEGVNYACDKCDYHALTLCNLTRHNQAVHEGVKYACNQCSYQATAQNHLKTHIEARHEGVKYGCNQCHYQGSKDSLRHHLKQKHS